MCGQGDIYICDPPLSLTETYIEKLKEEEQNATREYQVKMQKAKEEANMSRTASSSTRVEPSPDETTAKVQELIQTRAQESQYSSKMSQEIKDEFIGARKQLTLRTKEVVEQRT